MKTVTAIIRKFSEQMIIGLKFWTNWAKNHTLLHAAKLWQSCHALLVNICLSTRSAELHNHAARLFEIK